ncbi:MAG TPA: hypothetical protein VJM12_03285 [Pyrinomonadaceae bacterium]|nr:hypothetical protein [Pyrinomonadaceae bacterium]
MEPEEQDWGAWSQEAVRLMETRNRASREKFDLDGRPYRWNLDHAQIAFLFPDHAVVADLCDVGSVSKCEGTFLWAWANEAVGDRAKARLHEVRAFGEKHDLGLLTTAEWQGGRSEGLEMLAIAGRLLDADGVWIDDVQGGLTLFFTLHRFRILPLMDVAWLTEASDSP